MSKENTMTLIVTHKNCMDGLASAAMTEAYFKEYRSDSYEIYYAQYGDDFSSIIEHEAKNIIFTDFSLSRDDMVKVCNNFESVTVLDHHKTAEANLKGLSEQFSNYTEVFDMGRSGAMIVYDYFIKGTELEDKYDKQLIEYIQDRDLWQWKLHNSEEVNEGLRHVVEMNDIESFNNVCECLTTFNLANRGATLIEAKDKYVQQTIQDTKSIVLHGISFECVNSTIHISEVGNAICKRYNKPAAVYQISSDGTKVYWSLRSIDTLPDVSEVAKAYGGGGHRNACGFEIKLHQLYDILN